MAIATEPGAKQRASFRSKSDLIQIGKALFAECQRDKVRAQAAVVAFSTVFALPAVVLLMVMAAALINSSTDADVLGKLRDLIRTHAPTSTKQLLNDQVDAALENVRSGGLSIGILFAAVLAIWSGSAAVASLIDAFNHAYGVEDRRSFKKQKLLTIGLTLGLALATNVAFALLVFGRRLGVWIADLVNAGTVFDFAWNLGRWPAAVLAIAGILALLYYLGPDVEQDVRQLTPGVVVATIGWLIATAGIGVYLRFSDPGSAYGLVGSVLVLLFYLHVTAIVFIVGAELNALLESDVPDRKAARSAGQTATDPTR